MKPVILRSTEINNKQRKVYAIYPKTQFAYALIFSLGRRGEY
jgi:hypothetical protein